MKPDPPLGTLTRALVAGEKAVWRLGARGKITPTLSVVAIAHDIHENL
jgi:hypothetical protein